jgi:hypothetical protein
VFWRGNEREIDFVRSSKPWVEVKAGRASSPVVEAKFAVAVVPGTLLC